MKEQQILQNEIDHWYKETGSLTSEQIVRRSFSLGLGTAYEVIDEKYEQWCKETKRGGSVLVGGSIREFFKWLQK